MRKPVQNLRILALVVAMAFQLILSGLPAFACEPEVKTATASTNQSFKDVPATHWAYNAIMWMTRNGILNGVGEGRFKPDDSVTREQFAKMMVLALQISTKGTFTQSFSDVPKNSWAFKYVEAAKPYLTGWRMGTNQLDMFKPGDVAVREDMAVALVKALDLHNETPDLSVLNVFSDKDAISTNLQRHVALAVSNGIMNGSLLPDGSKAFDAQGMLTRAQAAVLVFNALVQAGEKVAYDDDPTKVVYDDPDQTGYPVINVIATKVSGDSIVVKWSRAEHPDFDGYKVVLSKGNPTPVYPEDGYLKWTTNRETCSLTIKAGQSYSGGDLGGKLQAGVKYYLSITAVYDDMAVKVPGNVVEVTLPGTATQNPLPATTLAAEADDEGVLLTWERIADERFVGYKVVLSLTDSTPTYPENGYLVFYQDADQTSVLLEDGESYNGTNDFGGKLESGKTYYARITVLFDGGAKTHSNVIEVPVP